MRNDKENIIVDKSLQYAVDIIAFSEVLEEKRKYVIAKQILKSGTSMGANIWEAQNAESKDDFIHKMKIAAKEADETDNWLELCKRAPSYPHDIALHEKLFEIIRILSKIIGTSKR